MLRIVAVGLALAFAAPTPTPAAPADVADATAIHELDLTGVADSEIAALPDASSVPTGDEPPSGARLAPDTQPEAQTAPEPEPDILTTPEHTADFSVLGFTWDHDSVDVVVRYRVHDDDGWGEWNAVGESDASPDPNSTEGRRTHRRGSDPIVAMGSDGLQVWAESATGDVDGLTAVLVDPATSSELPSPQAASRSVARADVATSVIAAAPADPGIIRRSQWGADESLRSCEPDYSPAAFVSAAVHHTASSNDYSPADVPGILNGIMAFHTAPEADGGRGWCDIGYNFLVDRFGRIFEGRAGSVDTTVIGVHTGGFNSRTIGVAAIGNYAAVGPSAELLEGISRVIAWRFATFGIRAADSVQMVSGGGASKYPEGTVVLFPTIYGHRDAQLTTCPGQFLYDALGSIRGRVSALVDATVGVSPRGAVDSFAGTTAGVRVAGWTYDRTTDASINVLVDVDGARTTARAGGSRPDVAAAFGVGPSHGFDLTVPTANGRHLVCVSAQDVDGGVDVLLGCAVVTTTNKVPFGAVDTLQATATGIHVAGWTIDPDTRDPIDVHVYIDAAGYPVRADRSRPDVDAAFHMGAAHGFDVNLPVAQGPHTVCIYPINSPSGANPPLVCRQVTVGAAPIGALDVAVSSSGAIRVEGWTLDPDTTDPIQAHVYVDDVGTPVVAAGSRPDIAAAFGRGDKHGYSLLLGATSGNHRVCAWGIDSSGGANTLLGCRTVGVVNRQPVGALDIVSRSGNDVRVAGWAADPDTSAPSTVHVWLDDAPLVALTAAGSRPDVAAAFGNGAAHGFDATVRVPAGSHRVCLYGIDSTGGVNPLLGCRSV